jgi:hypothetical protein
MVGRRLHPIMPFGMFLCPLWKMQGFTSCKNKPTFFGHLLFSFFISFFISFLSVGRHCFVNWSHFGRCCHCQPHSNRLGITGGFFSWGDCDSGNLGEGTTLYDGYSMDFFSSHHRSFWVSCDCDSGNLGEGTTLLWWLLNGLFFLLTIEVFGCLHKQSDIFFHRWAYMTWTTKGIGSPLLLMLHSFDR